MRPRRAAHVVLFVLLPVADLVAAGLATSDNFLVLTASLASPQQDSQYAEAVLFNAESLRKEIAREWLGEELPPSVGKTTVNVAFSDQRDAGLTWAKDDPRRQRHMLYLTTSPEKALGSTLAHEMVHVVFATRFPHPNGVAAWLEEGIASKYDDPDRQATRDQILSWAVKTGNWPRLETVLDAQAIPATEKEMYAVAASLTDFFLARGDKATLIAFGLSGRKRGWDPALQEHYRLRDVQELQVAWQAWVRESRAAATR